MAEPPPYDAVVLAGGSARRLGGLDKPALVVGGRTLLDRVLAAVADASVTVVVGPRRTTMREVTWAREDPPGGGPVAALAAALTHVTSPLVAVLAADLPFLDARTVQALRAAVGDGEGGALLVDDEGQDQLLVGVWRTAALRAALPAAAEGVALRRVLAPLTVRRVTSAAREGRLAPWFDVDTDADVTAARSST